MAPHDLDRVWGELSDLRRRVDRLSLAVVALAVVVGGSRLAETLAGIVGGLP